VTTLVTGCAIVVCMQIGRLLDAAILSTAAVLVVGICALVLFTVTAMLERWVERPVPTPVAPAVPTTAARPVLFDQDADHGARQAS
jgi:hypothetical protein